MTAFCMNVIHLSRSDAKSESGTGMMPVPVATLHDTVRYMAFLCRFGLLSCKLLQHAHMSVHQPRLQMNHQA